MSAVAEASAEAEVEEDTSLRAGRRASGKVIMPSLAVGSGGSSDPVRMYLREIGQVSLLTRS